MYNNPRNLEKAANLLEHIKKEDDTVPKYNNEEYNDILQERIDANIARAQRGIV